VNGAGTSREGLCLSVYASHDGTQIGYQLQGKLSNGQEKIDDPHTEEGWGVQWLVGVYVLSREGQT